MALLSFVESDADGRPEIALFASLLRITRHIDLARGLAMTRETRCRVVFRHEDAKGVLPIRIGELAICLALRPVRFQELLVDHSRLPAVRTGLAVANQVFGSGHLDSRQIAHAFGELL